MIKVVLTADGSHTLYSEEYDEHYHSVNGAILESETVFINNGLIYSGLTKVRIYEVGFGTGLNAFLSMREAHNKNLNIFYCASEKFPVGMDIVSLLNFTEKCSEEEKQLFIKLHEAEWNKETAISEQFTLKKELADIEKHKTEGIFDIVYFDAFAPSKQPEMWSKEIIGSCCDLLEPGGIFVTYSVRGELKRILKKNGFEIHILPGPPGKREVLRAIKK